ncbi:MAG: glycosyltransferase family 4 protein [Thermodesulfobacteriota bacterium]
MKICIFSIVTYRHGIKGGMEVHEKLLSEGLAEREHDVTIISSSHPKGTEFEERNGVKLYYLKNTIFGSKRGGWKTASLKKFIELEQVNNFDIICSMSAIIPKELITIERKTPVIVISEGTGIMMLLSEIKQTFSHRNGFKNLIKIFLSFIYYYIFWELSLKKYDAIIAVSNEVAKSTLKWYFVNERKVYTVFNGVEVDLFRPDRGQRKRIRESLAISGIWKILIFFSLVTKQKGLHLLIKALPDILKECSYIKLLVAGEGDYLTEARQLTGELGLEDYVVFTGYIPREEAPNYINASDVFVLPTLRQEGMPFSLLEAMACSKPVIASRIGGTPSVIDDGVNGLLIPPENVSILIEKTIFLLNNKDIADKLADNARNKIIQNFSHEQMIEETIKVFELAITRKKEQG